MGNNDSEVHRPRPVRDGPETLATMQEHHIHVRRTARYYTLGKDRERPDQVWLVCHGYGQLATQFIRYFQTLDDGTRLVVAPEGLSRFYADHGAGRIGASWMTREDRLNEIDDYVAYLDAVVQSIPVDLGPGRPRLYVLGFSQGAPTVCRWIARSEIVPDRLIVWGGQVPPDIQSDDAWKRLGACDLTLVFGNEDEYGDDATLAKEEARLRARQVPYRLVRFAGGHRIDKQVLRQLATT